MKKVILSLAIVALAAFSANAQSKEKKSMQSLRFSVGVDAGLPIADAGDVYSLAIGGDAQGEYAATPEVGITLSAGVSSWSIKSAFGGGSTTSIPVLAGGRYYFSDRKVYASVQAGVTIFTAKGGGSSTSGFTYAPGVGYYITDNIDAMLKYQSASVTGGNISQVALRVAYNF
ncbi:porin family protein [Ferruginibacter lapsinanis]|uniref:outer membrane beta-barrel protein n=1 Tax=Ferruginibacter lapsinanis TaxID=563172 RepID=UPI001E5CF98E|nr:outer membrane beta-barrel protein [Ferruginibacter lapsinanis]UEG49925.1 porin family protein [Ferruginibacter lapsinanis]